MPSLESAGTIMTSTSATGTQATNRTSTTAPTSTSTSSARPYVYSYATSKIVRTAVAAGVIVLALTALVLFFKISSYIRTRQRLRRQRYLTSSLQSEQRANAYEIAAWSDEPGIAPSRVDGEKKKSKSKSKSRKERREEMRAVKRGGTNAWGVHEWEGVAA